MTVARDLVDYRRERAQSTLQDARLLCESGSLFSAVNRIYYAVFYEVLALQALHGLSSPKHSGVRAIFNERFVKPGYVSTDSGRFYSRMFDFRQKSDYADFVTFEDEKVAEWLMKAEAFVAEIERVIEHGTGGESLAIASQKKSNVPWRVVEVVAGKDFSLQVRFVDGLQGRVEMKGLIFSSKPGVFAALADPELFAKVYLEYGAVTWPGEIDLAPDAMHAVIKAGGVWVVE